MGHLKADIFSTDKEIKQYEIRITEKETKSIQNRSCQKYNQNATV